MFDALDTKQLGRIDSMELLTVLAFSAKGNFSQLMENIVLVFGFESEGDITKDEYHFFLDCLFRGIMKLTCPKGCKDPPLKGRRVIQTDLAKAAAELFSTGEGKMNKKVFIDQCNSLNDGITIKMLKYFNESLMDSVQIHKNYL